MTLTERIDAAIARITRGHGAMSIPPDPTDPDLVLAECRALLDEVARLRADLDVAESRKSQVMHDLVASRDAEKARADRAEAALRCPDETYDHVHRCVRCDSEVTP